MQMNDTATLRRPASSLPSLSSSPHSEAAFPQSPMHRSQSLIDLNFDPSETRARRGSFDLFSLNGKPEQNYPFMNINPEDLKLGDIPVLLNEYKKLVEENKLYKELMKNFKAL